MQHNLIFNQISAADLDSIGACQQSDSSICPKPPDDFAECKLCKCQNLGLSVEIAHPLTGSCAGALPSADSLTGARRHRTSGDLQPKCHVGLSQDSGQRRSCLWEILCPRCHWLSHCECLGAFPVWWTSTYKAGDSCMNYSTSSL